MNKTILVTGGTGYIGSHTTVELIKKGFNVVIIDDLSNSNEWIAKRVEQITGVLPALHVFDICDKQRLEEFFAASPGIDAAIHFAAYKAVGESVVKPLDYYRNNLVSLLNLMEVMEQHKVVNLVFSSSCTVYGQPDQLPVTEMSPIKEATSPYGNSKQICEEMIRDYIASGRDFRATLLRYFNPIGAHESALIGEFPTGVPNNLVPFITQTAAGKRPLLRVFGNDYNTPDGSCIRDYIDVVDLAKAHVEAVDRMLNHKMDGNLEIFNLGTGRGISVLEVIKAFEKSTGVSLPYQIVERRAGDVEQVWADTSKANKVLGWTAQIPLEETMRNAWKWEKTL